MAGTPTVPMSTTAALAASEPAEDYPRATPERRPTRGARRRHGRPPGRAVDETVAGRDRRPRRRGPRPPPTAASDERPPRRLDQSTRRLDRWSERPAASRTSSSDDLVEVGVDLPDGLEVGRASSRSTTSSASARSFRHTDRGADRHRDHDPRWAQPSASPAPPRSCSRRWRCRRRPRSPTFPRTSTRGAVAAVGHFPTCSSAVSRSITALQLLVGDTRLRITSSLSTTSPPLAIAPIASSGQWARPACGPGRRRAGRESAATSQPTGTPPRARPSTTTSSRPRYDREQVRPGLGRPPGGPGTRCLGQLTSESSDQPLRPVRREDQLGCGCRAIRLGPRLRIE